MDVLNVINNQPGMQILKNVCLTIKSAPKDSIIVQPTSKIY